MIRSRSLFALLVLALAATGACANSTGSLVIIENQKPTVDMTSNQCVVSTDTTDPRLQGTFDVDLDRPYPYFVYPLVASRFPSVTTSAGIEQNSIVIEKVRVAISPPAGVNPAWAAGCPGTFDWPASAVLDPGATRALAAKGFEECHSQHLRDLIAAGAIPADLSQPVFFTLNLTVYATHGGDEIASATFPYQVQVCAGCLQSMYPATPLCSATPKPNPFPGNHCNIAQDEGLVLCCKQADGSLVCPAPDA